jgi:hypothetical protein
MKFVAELTKPVPQAKDGRLEGLALIVDVADAEGTDDTTHTIVVFDRRPAPANDEIERGWLSSQGRSFTREIQIKPLMGTGVHRLEFEIDGVREHVFFDVTV